MDFEKFIEEVKGRIKDFLTEKCAAYVKKVNAMVEKKKQNKK